jgi:predicted GNAT family acetyltransferase
MTDTVTDNTERRRFEMPVEGLTAFVAYRRANGVVYLDHAEVPPELEGRGIGGRLVRATLDAVRAEGAKVVPRCSFVAAWLRRHQAEFGDFVHKG